MASLGTITLKIEFDNEDRKRLDAIINTLANTTTTAVMIEADETAEVVEAEEAEEAAPPETEEVDDDDFLDEEEKKIYTRNEVRNALKEYAKVSSKEEAIEILNNHNVTNLGDLKETDYKSVIDSINHLTSLAKK